MKKVLSLIMSICLLATTFVGCAKTTETVETVATETATAEPISVITTIFPLYDWTATVLGDVKNVELTFLIDNGVDVHSYQPSTNDIIEIAQCDLFIYVGGESDAWVDDALANAMNPDMVVLNLMDILGDSAKVEELVEGMEAHDHDHDEEEEHVHDEEEEHVHDEEEEHDHDEEEEHVHDEEEEHVHDEEEEHVHDEEEEHVHEEEGELDEHIWLSITNAKLLTQAISDALIQMVEEESETIQANTSAYLAELDVLDQQYEEVVAAGSTNTLVFGDRFPFRYLVDEYGLSYYAAFSGCSAETEASFETIVFLANKLDELELSSIMTIEGTEHKIAETVIDNTAGKDQTVLVIDSMQSVTAADAEAGATYLNIMETNLVILTEALG